MTNKDNAAMKADIDAVVIITSNNNDADKAQLDTKATALTSGFCTYDCICLKTFVALP